MQSARHRRSRTLLRDEDGAVYAEAVVMLPVFLTMLGLLYLVKDTYEAHMETMAIVRSEAWIYSNSACEQSPQRSSVGELDPRLGDRFEGLVDGLLARDPEARFPSATAARDAVASLDWTEPAGRSAPAVTASSGASRISLAPSPRPHRFTERYPPLADPLPKGFRARDALLGRTVLVLPCSPERARELEALARADGPHLQAVYDLDREAGQCVLEDPAGVPLSSLDARTLDARAVEAELREALARIHALGLAHGSVDAAHVCVGPGRAVLLLPDLGRRGDPDADRAALAALFG